MNAAHSFSEREVYVATLLASAALVAISAAYARTMAIRAAIACLGIATSLLIFSQLKSNMSAFDALLGVMNGLVVLSLFWFVDQIRQASWRWRAPSIESLCAAGVTGLFFLLLAAAGSLGTSKEEMALKPGRNLVQMLHDGDLIDLYNNFHPSLRERVSFAKFQTLFSRQELTLRHLSITGVTLHRDYDELNCSYGSSANPHTVTIKQGPFSGRMRITDGAVESLMDVRNKTVIYDIFVDSRSIFPGPSR